VKHDQILNEGLTSLLAISLGICALAAGLDSDPLWAQIFNLISSPIAALAGGYLALRQHQNV